MRNLRGKRALVTGAASGIGRAIALRLADEGVHLALWDIDTDGLRQTADDCRSRGVESIDLTVDLACQRQTDDAVHWLLARWPDLDVLVNNAGVGFEGPTQWMTHEQWQAVMRINLLAPIQITHGLLPTLLSRPEAHLLNVSSFLGLCPIPRGAAYCSSKFGLVGLTESLRMEYRRTPLGVTALCPGFVRTKLFDHGQGGDPSQPVRRPAAVLFTTPDRVADKAIVGIRRNRAKVLVTPLAHSLSWIHRYMPSLLEWGSRIGRRKGPQPLPDSPPCPAGASA